MKDSQSGAREVIVAAIEQHKRTGELLEEALKVISGESVTVGGLGTWDAGKLHRVWNLTTHLPGPHVLLQACAKNPGEWVSFNDIAEAAYISTDQLRNEISRVHREMNNFGISDRPYEVKQLASLDYKTGYRMPKPIAELMIQVLRDDDSLIDG
jgi:hypothetical protein